MSAVAAERLMPFLDGLQSAFESQMTGRPDAALRRTAFARLLAHGLPGPRSEAWKYTNLRRLESRRFVPTEEQPLIDASELESRLLPSSGWHRVVLVNGQLSPSLSMPFPAAHGVTVRAFHELQDDTAGSTEAGSAATAQPAQAFIDLNAAFTRSSLVIELADGAELAEPLYFVHVLVPGENAELACSRIRLRAGARAKALLVEHFISLREGESLNVPLTILTLGDGARVEHYRIQEEGTKAMHVGHVEATLGSGAQLVGHSVSLGGILGRAEVDVSLAGSGADVRLYGLLLADGSRHLDTHTRVDHLVPGTHSDAEYRGIASGRGRGVFNGRVVVHAGAQKTVASQSSRNLILSPGAEIDTKPELEIYADDVKCSHGATTGEIDPMALFYLRSRGLGEGEARALLTYAFAESIVERMSLGPLRAHLETRLIERFRRNPEVLI